MSTLSITKPIAEIAQRGRLKPETVLELRRKMYTDGHISSVEADQLFYLDGACSEVCPEWIDFFVEALTDYLVYQVEPRGYVSVGNADWLIGKIEADGRVESSSELELLIKVIDVAKMVPPVLSAFVIRQVQDAVLDGEGAVRNQQQLQQGVIGAAEVDVLRRTIYAAGGAGHTAITQQEAEMLFDLNDATKDAKNDPSWSDLFVKAIANYLMAAHGYSVPSREDSMRRAKWVEDRSERIGGMTGEIVGATFSSLLVQGLKGVWQELSQKSAMEEAYGRRHNSHQMRIAINERVTEEEAVWLSERIGRDGVLHDNERALLQFVKEESSEVHSALEPLMKHVA